MLIKLRKNSNGRHARLVVERNGKEIFGRNLKQGEELEIMAERTIKFTRVTFPPVEGMEIEDPDPSIMGDVEISHFASPQHSPTIRVIVRKVRKKRVTKKKEEEH